MLNNIFDRQNISSQFRNIFNLLVPKTVIQQSNSNSMEKITRVIDSSIHQGVEKVEKIIGDTSELIRSPAKWLTDMQRNWLIYIICMAIICLCILFFYCACQGYCSRKRSTNSRLTNRLAEITMIMAKNNNTNLDKY
jgi:t-SNARE complex subunit (syntaxin)